MALPALDCWASGCFSLCCLFGCVLSLCLLKSRPDATGFARRPQEGLGGTVSLVWSPSLGFVWHGAVCWVFVLLELVRDLCGVCVPVCHVFLQRFGVRF